MRAMVIGSGGREDALAQTLAKSRNFERVIVAPGRERLRMLEKITTAPIAANDTAGLIKLARERDVSLIVPGPEAPLVAGFADEARRAGLNVFGPSAAPAKITEGSKCAAKQFMARNEIPTAEPFQCFGRADSPWAFIESLPLPIIVKDDKLAAGKGVTIAASRAAAFRATRELASRGHDCVIEPYLEGWEMTYTCLVAGQSFLPLASSRDFKIFNGRMTGGMAAISPEPRMTDELEAKILERIVRPTVVGLIAEGYHYCGFLYFGIMVVDGNPFLLEYNCRLGDPEAQVILPRLWEDLANVLYMLVTDKLVPMAASGGSLPWLRWDARAAATVVLAADGYPGSPMIGAEIFGVEEAEAEPDTIVFHAGTGIRDGQLIVEGGRVLDITGLGPNPRRALDRALASAAKITFAGMQHISEHWDVGLRD